MEEKYIEGVKENTEKTTQEMIEQVAKVHEEIRNRKGMISFLKYLRESGFYESPASTKFHGSYKGGLADHCWNLFCTFTDELMLKKLITEDFGWDSAFICSIGHDVCKIGLYLGEHKPFAYNKNHAIGHAGLSLKKLERHFTLTKKERQVIALHMGVYQTEEFKKISPWVVAEYNLKTMIAIFNENKIAKLFHYCDDIVSQFVDE